MSVVLYLCPSVGLAAVFGDGDVLDFDGTDWRAEFRPADFFTLTQESSGGWNGSPWVKSTIANTGEEDDAGTSSLFISGEPTKVFIGFMMRWGPAWHDHVDWEDWKLGLVFDNTSGTESKLGDWHCTADQARVLMICDSAGGSCFDENHRHQNQDHCPSDGYGLDFLIDGDQGSDQWYYIIWEVSVGGVDRLYMWSQDGTLSGDSTYAYIGNAMTGSYINYFRLIAYWEGGTPHPDAWIGLDHVGVYHTKPSPPAGFFHDCGNGTCGGGEDCLTCPDDCGVCCGDGICTPSQGETCVTCLNDCGECCGDGTCAAGQGEDCQACAADCGACCGDGICTATHGENCQACADDCDPGMGHVCCGTEIFGGNCCAAEDCSGTMVCEDHVCTSVETCQDLDHDGYGDPGSGLCDHPEPDCDDQVPTTHPGAVESCNGLDDNCSASTDEIWPQLGDACVAGLGACQAMGTVVCISDGSGAVCDAVPLSASPEVCDTIDNDCDGLTDEDGCPCSAGDTRLCYRGQPGTLGVGVCRAGEQACEAGHWSSQCRGEVVPSAEACDDQADNDCDGYEDLQDLDDCFGCLDVDGDGHLNEICGGEDCNDSDPEIHPEATENCRDKVDNDCDGLEDADDSKDCPATKPPGCKASDPATGLGWLLVGVFYVFRRRPGSRKGVR